MSESDKTLREAPSGARPSIRRWVRRIVVVFVAGCAMCFVLLVLHVKELSNTAQCGANVFELGHGMHAYLDKHGHFPPAHVDSPDGKRMHSWRILVTEDIGTMSPSPYRFEEPWDSQANTEYGDYRPRRYACPSDRVTQRNTRLTNYFVVEGPNTRFPGSATTTLSPLTPSNRKGRANSILVVEASGLNVEWLEPRDLTFDGMSFVLNDSQGTSISSPHPGGPFASMADGSVRSLKGIDPTVLRAMISYEAGQDDDD